MPEIAEATEPSGAKAPKRTYSPQTIKILFALSGNRCAAPGCTAPIIKGATKDSDAIVVGQICHIYALSDEGPRGKLGLTEAERNSPGNLILCCPTHHVVVDKQHETYPASMLLEWKARQDRAFGDRISSQMTVVGYAELDVAARALLSVAETNGTDIIVVTPKDKIERNKLGSSVSLLLKMGLSKSKEVSELLVKSSQLDSGFPNRLRSGFVQKYEQLKLAGCGPDELFFALYDWAGGADGDARRAAGLCILSHLFVICDVFEK